MRSNSGSGVVAYLRHADSRGVSSPGTLRCAPRTGLWQSAVAPRRWVRMSAVMRYYVSEAVMVRSAVGMTDALQRERRGGPQGGPVFSNPGQRVRG